MSYIEIPGHDFTSTSQSPRRRPGVWENSSACSCGVEYEWYGRVAEQEQK